MASSSQQSLFDMGGIIHRRHENTQSPHYFYQNIPYEKSKEMPDGTWEKIMVDDPKLVSRHHFFFDIYGMTESQVRNFVVMWLTVCQIRLFVYNKHKKEIKNDSDYDVEHQIFIPWDSKTNMIKGQAYVFVDNIYIWDIIMGNDPFTHKLYQSDPGYKIHKEVAKFTKIPNSLRKRLLIERFSEFEYESEDHVPRWVADPTPDQWKPPGFEEPTLDGDVPFENTQFTVRAYVDLLTARPFVSLSRKQEIDFARWRVENAKSTYSNRWKKFAGADPYDQGVVREILELEGCQPIAGRMWCPMTPRKVSHPIFYKLIDMPNGEKGIYDPTALISSKPAVPWFPPEALSKYIAPMVKATQSKVTVSVTKNGRYLIKYHVSDRPDFNGYFLIDMIKGLEVVNPDDPKDRQAIYFGFGTVNPDDLPPEERKLMQGFLTRSTPLPRGGTIIAPSRGRGGPHPSSTRGGSSSRGASSSSSSSTRGWGAPRGAAPFDGRGGFSTRGTQSSSSSSQPARRKETPPEDDGFTTQRGRKRR